MQAHEEHYRGMAENLTEAVDQLGVPAEGYGRQGKLRLVGRWPYGSAGQTALQCGSGRHRPVGMILLRVPVRVRFLTLGVRCRFGTLGSGRAFTVVGKGDGGAWLLQASFGSSWPR